MAWFTTMSPAGRRPGRHDTRKDILEAARAMFRSAGYEKATLRAIAEKAGVDPALIHHYFGGKAGLFTAVMQLPRDPRAVAEEARRSGKGGRGARVVERFLEQWERTSRAGRPGAGFITLAEAVLASPEAADATREFLSERVWSKADHAGQDDTLLQRRAALVSSQLVGLAWARYVMRIEPLDSAPIAQIAKWAGPTIDRYREGRL